MKPNWPQYETTDEEEARIQAGIDQDPDNPELTEEELASMRPFAEVFPDLAENIRLSRLHEAATTKEVTVRLDNEVLAALHSGGWGWRRRMNAMLRRELGLPQVDEAFYGAPLEEPKKKRKSA